MCKRRDVWVYPTSEIEAQGWGLTELIGLVGQEAIPHLSRSCLLGPV